MPDAETQNTDKIEAQEQVTTSSRALLNSIIAAATTPSEDNREIMLSSLMASVLITMTAISLAIMGLDQTDIEIDTIFGGLGLLSILGSALLVDHVMDSIGISTKRRWTEMNFGYFIFAFTIGGFIFSLLLMYFINLPYRPSGLTVEGRFIWVLFFIPSGFVFLKLMMKDEFGDLVTLGSIITVPVIAFVTASPYLFGWFRVQ